MKKNLTKIKSEASLSIGIVVPHIFMHQDILNNVIFAPGKLAIDLAEVINSLGHRATLYTPGPINTSVINITADLEYFEQELALRNDTYIDLLKKHPFTFITLARQVQSELLAKAISDANSGKLDIIHIYTNEEEMALPFSQLCIKPVIFTHHDPYNFLVKYKNVFPKYPHLNWLSISLAQRAGMPRSTNWVGNIYHGIDLSRFRPNRLEGRRYFAYLGRIIEPKGVHLAIQAVKMYNKTLPPDKRVSLKIAGKHYAGNKKDRYWQKTVLPMIDGQEIQYQGFIDQDSEKEKFLGSAKALLVPSTFAEPFGIVMIEALACGTPLIGLDSGSIPEVIRDGLTGFIVPKTFKHAKNTSSKRHQNLNENQIVADFVEALHKVERINPLSCRKDFEDRFTLDRMSREHLAVYKNLTKESPGQL